MPEHRIRLRGGWECQYREGESEGDDAREVVRRVALPLAWTADFPDRIRLVRHFGRPPVDPRIESVSLEMRNVAGLNVARINGGAIAPAMIVDPSSWSVPLDGPLLPRNGLVLEVDLATARGQPGEWGDISLLIRPLA